MIVPEKLKKMKFKANYRGSIGHLKLLRNITEGDTPTLVRFGGNAKGVGYTALSVSNDELYTAIALFENSPKLAASLLQLLHCVETLQDENSIEDVDMIDVHGQIPRRFVDEAKAALEAAGVYSMQDQPA